MKNGIQESFWLRLTFGFRYLFENAGLTGLLILVSIINFLMSFTIIILVPYVLSFAKSTTLGFVQSISGAGMLLGSIIIGIAGTHNKKIPILFFSTILSGIGLLIMGLYPDAFLITAGLFITMFIGPIASSHAVEIWQKKVPFELQGRVASARMSIGWVLPPFAFLSAGYLADHVFIPMFNTPTEGLASMFVISGILLTISASLFLIYPPLKNVERDIPDALYVSNC
ncbi:MAG: hypothetical protein EH225_11760 [Calditrichaeota bacterium]|nr:hypothetical protein [Spirochaetales bacterium]RQV99304.1 MAG: hypothetical protein EH225_11760 [Calditrichota bacterium]